MDNKVSLESIVSLAKRRGFVYPSNEIYGGLNGVYDFGPLGVAIKENLRILWKKNIKSFDGEIVFLDGSILGTEALWKSSGHLEGFSDPMVDCQSCKKRFRADDVNLEGACPACGRQSWTEVKQFNMMFQTTLGATSESGSKAYLRPETAQSVFVNFKNVLNSSRMKLPFGIAQIGKAFRNEITPKQFLFRMREFEQMEIEWFCREAEALEFFEMWLDFRKKFFENIGIKSENVKIRSHEKDELSHYSKATSDVEYLFPFGWREVEGIAYRGDFDLSQHIKFSGKDLHFHEEDGQAYVPHVVECSVGIDRLLLAVLCDAYCEEKVENETRVVMRFNPEVAPVRAAFLPLTKTQIEPMQEIYKKYKTLANVQLDLKGSIGRRYRRQDEIGTPYCFTFDFESSADNCVTIRHRDDMKQKRIQISQIESYL